MGNRPKRLILPRVAAVLLAGVVLQFLLPHLSDPVGIVVTSVPIAVTGFFAAAGFLRWARVGRGRLRAGWGLGAVAAVTFGVAYLVYIAAAVLGHPPESAGDGLSLLAAVLATGALVLASPRLTDLAARLTLALDVTAVAGALYALAWQQILSGAQGDLEPGTFLMFAVIMAVEALAAALALVLMSRSAPTPNGYALRLLAGGLGIFALAAGTAVHNDTEDLHWYATGAGGGYLVATLLIGLASRTVLPSADRTGERVFAGIWPILPYIPVVLALAEVLRSYVRTGTLTPVLVWFLLTAVAVAMLRQLLMLATIRSLIGSLRHQADHDALTGLPNRAAFYGRAAAELAAAELHTAVLVLDLDGFKQVNDTMGHAAGDALLIEVARRLTAAVRAEDTAARLGGDEFVAILPALLEPDQADEVAARMLHDIGQPMIVAGRELCVRASVGIAVCRGPGHELDRLLVEADLALYEVKDAGKGTFRRNERVVAA
ncbi:GGDEF domain-containing protein [Actinoplanes sp. NPDC026619]|uniref:GGDEF domain-containing protein n=1 Tax=Actinoplanes sp. NPDC026619 TaxID=3155798 RepID=UPI0033FD8073